MKAIPLIALSVLLHPAIALADPEKPSLSTPQERVVQDEKTKTIYYLESDQCHLIAISPDGKVLWAADSHQVRFWHVTKFKISATGNLDIEGWNGQGGAIFDGKTGTLLQIVEL